MTVVQAASTWAYMLADANVTAVAVARRHALRSQAVDVLRTTVLLVVAALAILVLLPAAIAAQGAYVG